MTFRRDTSVACLFALVICSAVLLARFAHQGNVSIEDDYHGFDLEYWRVHILPPMHSSFLRPSDDCPFLTRPTEDAIPLFRQLLKDSSFHVRGCVLSCIQELGGKSRPLVTDVTVLINDPQQVVRLMAIRTLAKMGPAAKGAIISLTSALASDDLDTRCCAAQAWLRLISRIPRMTCFPCLRIWLLPPILRWDFPSLGNSPRLEHFLCIDSTMREFRLL